MLVREQLLTEADLARALEEQRKTKRRIGQVLTEMGLIREDKLLDVLGRQFHLDCLDPEDLFNIPPDVLKRVSEPLARSHTVIPVAIAGETLSVATADPLNVVALSELRQASGMQIQFKLARSELVQRAIERHYARLSEDRTLEGLLQPDEAITIRTVTPQEEGVVDLRELRQQVDLAPVVRLVNRLLALAIDERASDIHIEPYEDRTLVRNRIDGTLFEVTQVPAQLHLAVVSRVKILSNMDIAERRLPQDGAFRVSAGGVEYDFRVSTLPTINGEKVVMRLLEREGVTAHYTLASLGFEPAQLQVFEAAIRRPWGMILMTGPTGSGKSTTLHTALKVIRTARTNIITVEDPVEYRHPGIQQVQVRPNIGLDFASALRTILRQDPDIIMVGEIRDVETAQMAVRAALTGHLLFSTLHTNDAVSTLIRLVNIGLEPYLVASAVTLAASQRLLRKLCVRCKEPYEPPPAEQALFDFLPEPPTTLYRGRSCASCRSSGYSGRVAVYELFPITPDVRVMVQGKIDLDLLRRYAAESGVDSLRRSGLRKAATGITSLDEVLATCTEEA